MVLALALLAAEAAPVQVGVYPFLLEGKEPAFDTLAAYLKGQIAALPGMVPVDVAADLPCEPEDIECLAAAGSFAGVDRVVRGRIAQIGDSYSVRLLQVEVATGTHGELKRVLQGGRAGLHAGLAAMICELLRGADCAPMAAVAVAAPPPPAPPSALVGEPLAEEAPPKVLPWILAGAAALAVGAGGLLGSSALEDFRAADTTDHPEWVDTLADTAGVKATFANLLYAAGVAATAGAVLTFVF
jgi:hypothetical protein